MILVDVHTGLILALKSHAGAGGLRQTVNVVGLDAQIFFDVAAHLLSPGLRTEDAGLQFIVLGLVSHFLQSLTDVGRVGGGTAENGGAQIHHKLDLSVRITGGHRQGQTAHLVGAAVHTGAAGEQTVAVGNLHHVILRAAHGGDGTGTAVLPQIHVVLGVEGYHAAAGGAGGGLDAYAVGEGFCQKAVGILIPQIILLEEGQFVQILHPFDIVGGDAFFLHQRAVVGYVVPYMANLTAQTLALQGAHLLIGHGFDFFLIIFLAH